MKRMKKSLGLLAAAFALCLAFAVSAKVDAADMKMGIGTVEEEKSIVKPMNIPDFAVAYISSDKRTASFDIAYYNNGAYTRIGIFDTKGNLVAYDDALIYATVEGLRPNRLYYYRAQSIAYNGGPATSGWSAPKAFTTLTDKKIKLNGIKGKRAFTIKVPKLTGIKNYSIYVSKKRDSGYKKVKTVKPGKKVTISKFKKSSFKLGRTYYVKVTQKTKKNITCGNYFTGYVYFYRTYR